MLQIDLTPERQAQISGYLEKWRQILSTPIDRDKAIVTLVNLYQRAGYPAPEVMFIDSPTAFKDVLGIIPLHDLDRQFLAPSICDRFGTYIIYDLKRQFQSLNDTLLDRLVQQLATERGFYCFPNFCTSFVRYFSSELSNQWNREYYEWALEEGFLELYPETIPPLTLENLQQDVISSDEDTSRLFWRYKETLLDPLRAGITHAAMYDCAAAFGVEFEPETFQCFLDAAKHLEFIVPFEKICFIRDRPLLKFDSQGRLHAEGEPCILFPDGPRSYFYHGTKLPAYMGAVHPHRWSARWVIQERNARLRQILIQEIGYARLCQELEAKVVDSWREYTLLSLPIYDDSTLLDGFSTSPLVDPLYYGWSPTEPTYLLKMTCPSTGSIYALRVPPKLTSAKEAAIWINWGVDPESFAVET
jgi:hypothetical protein